MSDLGIELVGLLAELFQKAASLLGDKDALDAAVDRICLPKYDGSVPSGNREEEEPGKKSKPRKSKKAA